MIYVILYIYDINIINNVTAGGYTSVFLSIEHDNEFNIELMDCTKKGYVKGNT